jgi:hypothetical protein
MRVGRPELGFLDAETPQARAWCALARRDYAAARQALTEYEHELAALPQKWEADPGQGIRYILCYPDQFFQIERRALNALLERADLQG